MWQVVIVGIMTLGVAAALGDEPAVEKRPPYERVLTGDNAVQAKVLATRIAFAQQGDPQIRFRGHVKTEED